MEKKADHPFLVTEGPDPVQMDFFNAHGWWVLDNFGSKKRRKTMNKSVMEIWLYIRERKQFWLIPLILAIVLCSVLVVFSESSILAPFIYTLF